METSTTPTKISFILHHNSYLNDPSDAAECFRLFFWASLTSGNIAPLYTSLLLTSKLLFTIIFHYVESSYHVKDINTS